MKHFQKSLAKHLQSTLVENAKISSQHFERKYCSHISCQHLKSKRFKSTILRWKHRNKNILRQPFYGMATFLFNSSSERVYTFGAPYHFVVFKCNPLLVSYRSFPKRWDSKRSLECKLKSNSESINYCFKYNFEFSNEKRPGTIVSWFQFLLAFQSPFQFSFSHIHLF